MKFSFSFSINNSNGFKNLIALFFSISCLFICLILNVFLRILLFEIIWFFVERGIILFVKVLELLFSTTEEFFNKIVWFLTILFGESGKTILLILN